MKFEAYVLIDLNKHCWIEISGNKKDLLAKKCKSEEVFLISFEISEKTRVIR